MPVKHWSCLAFAPGFTLSSEARECFFARNELDLAAFDFVIAAVEGFTQFFETTESRQHAHNIRVARGFCQGRELHSRNKRRQIMGLAVFGCTRTRGWDLRGLVR